MTSEADSTFVITRVFAAPPDLTFKAWTDAGHLGHWWGPKGFKTRIHALDLRPGGILHYSMQIPDGTLMWGKWVFREIVAPKRLVIIVSFSDAEAGDARNPWAPDWPLEVLSTITFVAHDGGTLLTMRGEPLHASEAERKTFEAGFDSMRQGWAGTLDQLTEHLAKA